MSSPLSNPPSDLAPSAHDSTSFSTLDSISSESGKFSDEFSDDDSGDDSPSRRNTILVNRRRIAALSRQSRQIKLRHVIKPIRPLKWTFEDLMEAWVGDDGELDVPLSPSRRRQLYRTIADRRHAEVRALGISNARGVRLKESLHDECARELDQLLRAVPFGKFELGMDIDMFDHKQGALVMQEIAPQWFYLMRSLLKNRW
jgi:hypothetical protein